MIINYKLNIWEYHNFLSHSFNSTINLFKLVDIYKVIPPVQ